MDWLAFGVVMKLSRFLLCGVAGVVLTGLSLLAANTKSPDTPVSTLPVYVPNLSHSAGPLPDGVLAWDATTKETNVIANTPAAHFVFNFTNIATEAQATLSTNVVAITNVTTVTNSSFWARLIGKRISHVTKIVSTTNIVAAKTFKPVPVTILSVHPSCGCTTAKLPRLPWTLAPGTNGHFGVTVNLEAKSGILYKTLMVYTDKGSKTLLLKITIRPFEMPKMSEAQRELNRKLATADRQMVFKGECATCHVQQGQGEYGEALYKADCAICHEGEHRATMVPDLHQLKTPTNFEFWRTWISHGKPGTLMPAFSKVDGGPLSDIQIASLARYLTVSIQSK